MEINVLESMAAGGFEQVIAINDTRSGLRAFLAIHDTSAGPAFGGIRRWVYRTEEEALQDVLRLSRAMTHKCVLADLPAGGGKMVALDHASVDWPGAYRHIGQVVEELGGRFYTGPDVGTGADELGWAAERTRFVTHPGESGPGELAEATAAGVFHGIAAALRHLDGEEDWPSRRIVVQGLGAVGERLSRQLVERGARVTATEIDGERAERVTGELDLELVAPTKEVDVRCDVFAPCALGGILHDLTVPRLACRIVAGGANNVLARPEHGDALHRRGILYIPDFVINCGALIRGAIFHLEGRREAVETIGERIGRILNDVLGRAQEAGVSPVRQAIEQAERKVEERRESVSADRG
jgi:leucine dehydrogenase